MHIFDIASVLEVEKMNVWDEKSDVVELLKDMGFEEFCAVPGWAHDLAIQLIESGWKKKK